MLHISRPMIDASRTIPEQAKDTSVGKHSGTMTSFERHHDRVNAALTEADEILKRQQEGQFRLKVSGGFLSKSIFALDENGRPLTKSELQTAPAALKEAWSGLAARRWSIPATNRLLRIALYYRLLFSNEILSSEESSDLPRLPPPQTTEESLALDVYNMTEADREAAGRGVRSGEPEETCMPARL
jgi:hypothetical protein